MKVKKRLVHAAELAFEKAELLLGKVINILKAVKKGSCDRDCKPGKTLSPPLSPSLPPSSIPPLLFLTLSHHTYHSPICFFLPIVCIPIPKKSGCRKKVWGKCVLPKIVWDKCGKLVIYMKVESICDQHLFK